MKGICQDTILGSGVLEADEALASGPPLFAPLLELLRT